VREVSRCVAALELGLKKLRGGLPLCMRLLGEMHETLLAHPRGRGKTPGEVRRSQVWIGGRRPGNAAFVPSPVEALPDCLTAFERFLNDEPEPVPPLRRWAGFSDHPIAAMVMLALGVAPPTRPTTCGSGCMKEAAGAVKRLHAPRFELRDSQSSSSGGGVAGRPMTAAAAASDF